VAAASEDNEAFYQHKLLTADFFRRQLLPRTISLRTLIVGAGHDWAEPDAEYFAV